MKNLVEALAEALDVWNGTGTTAPHQAVQEAKFLIRDIQDQGYNIELIPRKPGTTPIPNMEQNP